MPAAVRKLLGRRWSAGLLLLPPWRRAPLLALRQPTVILSVIAAAAVVACASSSAALFLSSSASEALRVQILGQCPDAAFPVLEQSGFGPGFSAQPDVDQRVTREMTEHGLSPPLRVVQVNGSVTFNAGSASTLGQGFYRDGAMDSVAILSRRPGDGVVLPQQAADDLRVEPGGSVQVGDASIPVVGIYRDLFTESSVRPFWCSYSSLFLNEGSLSTPPPALVLATSPAVAEQIGRAGGRIDMIRTWTSPIQIDGLTLSAADRVVQERQRAFDQSGISNSFGRPGYTGQLSDMTERTKRLVDGLRGPIIPIAIGGSILALLLLAAAGSYWIDRRHSEIRLLSSRGVGPAALAGKAALELGIPAAVGTALGWLLALQLTASLGPNPNIDPGSPRQAALTAAAGLILGVAMLTAVAALRAYGAAERPVGGQLTWAVRLPWEMLLLLAAVASWLRVRGDGGVIIDHNVAQVTVLLVAFPLLFLTGAAIFAVRLATKLIPSLLSRTVARGPAVYLAIRRISGATVVSAGLLVAVSLPVGMLVYSATLTGTSQTTLEAKARVVVGSDIAIISVDRPTRTAAIDAVGTVVARYPHGTTGGDAVTVLAVDPATFGEWAFWNNSFAELPLKDLLAQLGTNADGAVRAVATGLSKGTYAIGLGEREVSVAVVATAQTLPGRRQPDPLVIVDALALGPIDQSAGRFTELWSTRSEAEVVAALDGNTRVSRVQDRDTVFNAANFLSVEWTFGYLQALAAFVSLIALGGLLLFLETRQRTRVAAYAMARRMGLTGPTHLRSLIAELGAMLALGFLLGGALGWAAVLLVYRDLEVDPSRPPGPLLTLPAVAITVALTVTAAVALCAAGYAHRRAARADMAQVLRLGP